jgi:hypothetical protein
MKRLSKTRIHIPPLVEQRHLSPEAAIELRFLKSRFSRGEGQFWPGAALTGAQHPASRH